MREAVCALGSLRLMGGTQHLIICANVARVENLVGSDRRDEYSLNAL